MPKRNFAPGEVLTATNVNTYLTTSKNMLINGAFEINQRSFTSSTSGSYTFDRWYTQHNTGTITSSAQAFTPGSCPTGYESANFFRMITTGMDSTSGYALVSQKIEDVRTLAGQTATISFWAKAGSGTPSVSIELEQGFGSGGSPSSAVNAIGVTKISLTGSTAWTHYSATVSIPAITSKTIGTSANTSSLTLNFWLSAGSNFNSRTSSLGVQANTFDIWGVQLEEGSTATPFSRATPTIQSELAACQRYYWRTSGSSAYGSYGMGIAVNTTACFVQIPFPATMRTRPTSVESLAASNYTLNGTGSPNATSIAIDASSNDGVTLNIGATYTANNAYLFRNNNNTSAYLGFSAEL